MRIRIIFFGVGLAFILLYSIHNLIWIHPFPPNVFLATIAGICCAALVWLAPTLHLRWVALTAAALAACVTVWSVLNWNEFNRNRHQQAQFATSALWLKLKVEDHYSKHPEPEFINLAEYVENDVLSSNDIVFLQGYSVTIFPPRLGGNRFMEAIRGNQQFVIQRDGIIFRGEPAAPR